MRKYFPQKPDESDEQYKLRLENKKKEFANISAKESPLEYDDFLKFFSLPTRESRIAFVKLKDNEKSLSELDEWNYY
jgi:hypothetical protein